jgi:hypothetical protein
VSLPSPIIEKHGGIFIVRDDYLPGGTKRRVAHLLLEGANEVVYASPAYGYAQIALAYAGRESGVSVTIFTAKRGKLHANTQQAKALGAKVVLVPYGYLSNVQAKARSYAAAVSARYLPFGFNYPEIRSALANIAASLPIKPDEVWSVAGSGTLTKALQCAWPTAQFYAVQIGAHAETNMAVRFIAPEKFEHRAQAPPPFPSCPEYDAKAWRFIQRYASPGALFWNVAA